MPVGSTQYYFSKLHEIIDKQIVKQSQHNLISV